MSKIDEAIEWVERNMIMLYSISTEYEKEREVPDYVLNILKKHKREAYGGKEGFK